MIHIGGHLQDFAQNTAPRPDYHVLDHLWENKIIPDDDYQFQIAYTERPNCDGLLPLGSKKPGIRVKKEIETYNLDKEKREMKRLQREKAQNQGKGKGKERETHRSSTANSQNYFVNLTNE